VLINIVIVARSGSSHGNSGSHSNMTSDKCSCDEKIAELTRSHEQERRSHEQEVARLQQQLQTLQDHVSYDNLTCDSCLSP